VRGQVDAAVQRLGDGLTDHRVRVAIQAGGEFPQRIQVDMAVLVPQATAFAARHRQRKRRVEQHAAGVAPGSAAQAVARAAALRGLRAA
jgi:hypothetical protein